MSWVAEEWRSFYPWTLLEELIQGAEDPWKVVCTRWAAEKWRSFYPRIFLEELIQARRILERYECFVHAHTYCGHFHEARWCYLLFSSVIWMNTASSLSGSRSLQSICSTFVYSPETLLNICHTWCCAFTRIYWLIFYARVQDLFFWLALSLMHMFWDLLFLACTRLNF
jgi:hypothetical protein